MLFRSSKISSHRSAKRRLQYQPTLSLTKSCPWGCVCTSVFTYRSAAPSGHVQKTHKRRESSLVPGRKKPICTFACERRPIFNWLRERTLRRGASFGSICDRFRADWFRSCVQKIPSSHLCVRAGQRGLLVQSGGCCQNAICYFGAAQRGLERRAESCVHHSYSEKRLQRALSLSRWQIASDKL